MTMYQQTDLLKRLLDGENLNEEENQRLEQWADQAEENRALLTEIRSGWIPSKDILFFHENESRLQQAFGKLVKEYAEAPEILQHRVSPFRKIMKIAVAAAVALLLVGGAWYLWWPDKITKEPQPKPLAVLDIPAGKQGAVLTLDDGSQLVLDSITGGIVASQGGTNITLQNGLLEYDPNKTTTQQILYNTMSTPKARQFQLLLPDGSRAWLNAASSIRFPTRFTGNTREVSITGEVYFEIVKNDKAPFRVQIAGKALVDVLGTSFNVNAYEPDEQISTTLLEGSVKMSNNDQQAAVLKPGQQAVLGDRQIKLLNNVNTDQVMAWKNGVFNFDGITLESFMKEVGRWYDVDVVISKDAPNIEFQGEMSRDISLKDLMSSLEKFGVHYRVEGKKIIILP